MKINKTKFLVLISTITVFYKLWSNSHTSNSRPDVVSENHFGSDNKPVFIAGTQAFHKISAPAINYPAIKRNFLALTCALEVYRQHKLISVPKTSPESKHQDE